MESTCSEANKMKHISEGYPSVEMRYSTLHEQRPAAVDTVDGQNPAPPRMMIIPLFIGF